MKAARFIIGIFLSASLPASMQVIAAGWNGADTAPTPIARPGIVLTRGEVIDSQVLVKLRVHVIPTTYGAGESDHKYPPTISLMIPKALKDSTSAYGAADRIWLAPSGWDGTGAQGADGSTRVELRPHIDPSKIGANVIYMDEGGCAGCAIVGAALYFPSAKKQAQEFGFEAEKAPAGLKIRRISPRLVTFSFLGTTTTTVHGVAFYSGNSDYYFAQMRVVLPRSDAALTRFLLQFYMKGSRSTEPQMIR